MKNAPAKIKLANGKELTREWSKHFPDVCGECGHANKEDMYQTVRYIWVASDGTRFNEASGSAATKPKAWEACLRHLDTYHKKWKPL